MDCRNKSVCMLAMRYRWESDIELSESSFISIETRFITRNSSQINTTTRKLKNLNGSDNFNGVYWELARIKEFIPEGAELVRVNVLLNTEELAVENIVTVSIDSVIVNLI